MLMPATGTYNKQGLVAASLGFKAARSAEPARTSLTSTAFLLQASAATRISYMVTQPHWEKPWHSGASGYLPNILKSLPC